MEDLQKHNKQISEVWVDSVGQYFAIDSEDSNHRWELYGRKAIRLSAPSINHNEIDRNIIFNLNLNFHLNGSACKAYSSGIRVKSEDSYLIPDGLVFCDDIKLDENGNALNPVMLIEILSKSNSSQEMSRKLYLYLKLQSLKYYMIIDQYQYQIRIWHMVKGEWLCKLIQKQEDIELHFNGLPLTLDSGVIYRNVF